MSFTVMIMSGCFCSLLLTLTFPSVSDVSGTKGDLAERTP